MSVGAIRAGRAMVEIFADSSMLTRGLATAQGKLAKFASTLRRLGTAQVVLGASAAAPIAAAVLQYAKLEQRINTVRALSGASSAQMRGLAGEIRRVGMATGMAFTDIADAMAELSRAGVRLGDLGKATRIVADFSRSAGIDMARAANIGVEILTQFGLSMEHLPRVADVLQEMANATVSTVEDLSDGFRYAGQAASMFGLSLEEAGAAIAYLQQGGLSATTAGTSLNQMLLQIVQNMDKLEGAIGGIRDNAGEFLPFEQVLRKLQQHLKGMAGPERMQFLNEMFDVRGMRGAQALLRNVDEWLRLTAMAQASTGATARKAAEMAKAFVVSFEKMRNGVVMFSYAIGEALDPSLRSAFEGIGRFSERLAALVKNNQGIVQAIAKTSAALIASGVAFFSTGVAIQLALFSMEGFIKIASGLAGVAVAPVKMISASFGVLAGVARYAAGWLGFFSRIAMNLGGRVLATLSAALYGVIALASGLVTEGAALGRGMFNLARFTLGLVRANLMLLAVLPRMIGTFAAIGTVLVSTAVNFAAFAVGALAGPLAGLAALSVGAAGLAAGLGALGAGFVAVAVAADLVRRAVIGIGQYMAATGKGLSKVWDGLVKRTGTVWPEMVATVKAGWAGVTAALESGDLGMAWKVFLDTARAAFAQLMMIIGPIVDDAAEMLHDIGLGLYRGIEWAVGAAGDLFWGLRTAAQPVFEWLAGVGDWFIEGFDGVGGLFTSLGDHADEAGNRIYDALSAGDIVSAWAAAITAIRKMLIELGSFYEQYVGAPVRLFAEEMAGRRNREEMLGRHRAAFGREFSMRTAELSMTPQTLEELNAMEQRLLARPDNAGDEQRQNAIREAARFRREQLRAAGVMAPEARDAERQRQIDQAEADFQKKEADRKKRREQNEADRRKRADQARARAESSASSAAEARRNRELERGIDAATKPEEFDARQKEIDARRKERENAEAAAGIKPGAVAEDRRSTELWRKGLLDAIQQRRNTLADAVGSGDITEEQANVHSALLDQAEAAANSAQSLSDIDTAWADLNESAADAARGFGEGAMVPGMNGLIPPQQASDVAANSREEAQRNLEDLQRSQAQDNAQREQEATRLRAEAAEARRQGDEEVALAKEQTAAALEQALDAQEEADMQSKLDARREEFRKQQELRDQAGKGKDAGERAAQDKRLDAIGGFMNSAFDRLGFGSNLTERQLKAAEETRDGVNNLVKLARDGGIFIG